ncbi:HAD family hydrolase [Haloprofundus marisrubri]|uniref:HAD family hydrolase n=1 Tax=Haloprofundus marisrubri TaxID=1514971 RepID=A0A0W1R9M8_9EURY|nr:HAD-IIA family hydrolase [Haloprofundus marisrubri]KTG10141.1 HAD family hydrolase [Haloprofundus marisrubri]
MTFRGAILDVDGTVLRGNERIQGATAGLDALDRADVDRVFFSNNPTKAPPAYAERFAGADIEVGPDEVLTSGTATTAYLEAEHAADSLFVVGESGLEAQFTEAGLTVTTDPTAADAVVVSIDREFHYDDLVAAMVALEDESVPFLSTDPDMTIPGVDRDLPGSGAMTHAVSGVVGRPPDATLGKPSAHARGLALDRLGHDADECLVVGDRLDTDIALGASAGMTTVLVKTGITDDHILAESAVDPDYVLDSFADIEQVVDDQ